MKGVISRWMKFILKAFLQLHFHWKLVIIWHSFHQIITTFSKNATEDTDIYISIIYLWNGLQKWVILLLLNSLWVLLEFENFPYWPWVMNMRFSCNVHCNYVFFKLDILKPWGTFKMMKDYRRYRLLKWRLVPTANQLNIFTDIVRTEKRVKNKK